MTQKFRLEKLREIKNIKDRREVFGKFFATCKEKNEAPFLSDFLAEKTSWGGMPLQYIGEAEAEEAKFGGHQLQFRLKVNRDEWGNVPAPGDDVIHLVPNAAWRKATPTDESNARRTGTYDTKYKMPIKFKVDSKGCILCSFQSAVFFLNNFGVHCESREPLTKKPELSTEPVLVKKGSTEKKHVWYWRFEEVTDEQYKELPVISGKSNNK